jgi:hypothetical protein
MRRPIVALVACLLLTATGLGLLGVAATVTSVPVVVVATTTAESTREAMPGQTGTPEPEPVAVDITMPSPGGPVTLRVSRLALAPGAVLPPERTTAPTALIAELGAVGVRTYGADGFGQGFDETQADAVLRRGEYLVVGPDTVRTIRNAGPAPAVVLVVAIEAVAVPPTSHW